MFDGMTYAMIEQTMPEEFAARKADKLGYRCTPPPPPLPPGLRAPSLLTMWQPASQVRTAAGEGGWCRQGRMAKRCWDAAAGRGWAADVCLPSWEPRGGAGGPGAGAGRDPGGHVRRHDVRHDRADHARGVRRPQGRQAGLQVHPPPRPSCRRARAGHSATVACVRVVRERRARGASNRALLGFRPRHDPVPSLPSAGGGGWRGSTGAGAEVGRGDEGGRGAAPSGTPAARATWT